MLTFLKRCGGECCAAGMSPVIICRHHLWVTRLHAAAETDWSVDNIFRNWRFWGCLEAITASLPPNYIYIDSDDFTFIYCGSSYPGKGKAINWLLWWGIYLHFNSCLGNMEELLGAAGRSRLSCTERLPVPSLSYPEPHRHTHFMSAHSHIALYLVTAAIDMPR